MNIIGYHTDFNGYVIVTPPLNEHEVSYLTDFANTRRMDRESGPYFVKAGGFMGQENTPDVRDYNQPPPGQPGLWCQWVPVIVNDGETIIEWDGGEKFYNAAEWMTYIIDHFLREGARAEGSDADERLEHFTFDHVVNGVIHAQGEDSDDMWKLVVTDNEVEVQYGHVTYHSA